MMDNKKTEKYIDQALNSEKPNRERVLSVAKNIMAVKQRQPIKRAWRYYAAAAGSACLLIFGIIAAILNGQNLYVESNSNASLEQTQATLPTNFWLIVSIISISLAVIIGVIIIIVKVKNSKRQK